VTEQFRSYALQLSVSGERFFKAEIIANAISHPFVKILSEVGNCFKKAKTPSKS